MINLKATYTPIDAYTGKPLLEETVVILQYILSGGNPCFLAVRGNGQFFVDTISRFILMESTTNSDNITKEEVKNFFRK